MAGKIIFEGVSEIEGAPIAVIATDGTRNQKTGDMLQTWIIRTDVPPHVAARDGRDVSICGTCIHRRQPDGSRSCYVAVHNAPLAVFKAYHAGRYQRAAPRAVGAGQLVRIGSYGDPAAVPARVWRELLAESAGRTGYTHQWQHPDPKVRRNARALRGLVMASADTPAEAETAARRGWRTFRVRQPSQPLLLRERICPASAEAGSRVQCATCRACDGATRGNRIAIIDHGPGHVSRSRAANG
jgi:hypothetical protein